MILYSSMPCGTVIVSFNVNLVKLEIANYSSMPCGTIILSRNVNLLKTIGAHRV
jgi:hypothetical protein